MDLNNEIIEKIDDLTRGKLSDEEVESFYKELKNKDPSLYAEVKRFEETYNFVKNALKPYQLPEGFEERLFERIAEYKIEEAKSKKVTKEVWADTYFGLAKMAEHFGLVCEAKEYYKEAADLGHEKALEKLL
jgi:hypothetical protein